MKWNDMRIPVGICLSVNLLIAIFSWYENPSYWNGEKFINPDSVIYLRVGHNFFLEGAFSRDVTQPLKPDFGLTPIYPLFAAALEIPFSLTGLYFTQIVLSVLTCALIYCLTAQFFSQKIAWFGAMFFALDPLLWSYNLQPMSECLFLFLCVAGLFIVLPLLRKDEQPVKVDSICKKLFFGGILLGLAVLTRPSGLYLPIILLPFLLLFFYRRQMRWLVNIAVLLIFLLASYLPVGMWIVRNAIVFGTPALSRTQSIMLVYYTGASAWQVHYGTTLGEAQELIQKTYQLPSHLEVHNPSVSKMSPEEMERKLKTHQREILLKYPADLVYSSSLGVLRGLTAHNVGEIAFLNGEHWNSPDIENIWDFSIFAKRYSQNSLKYILLFLFSNVYNFGRLVLAILGGCMLLKTRKNLGILFVFALILAYIMLTMGLCGLDCVSRYRIPLSFILDILAASAISQN